ncbi:Pentatricopeptide repeat [Dillenia turbinata]|uniref:Pentatricopeptide repeat n=1 Tax=Dillenia turbinata TaxID=194707 RepID=A0AAN8URW3_9MAGN
MTAISQIRLLRCWGMNSNHQNHLSTHPFLKFSLSHLHSLAYTPEHTIQYQPQHHKTSENKDFYSLIKTCSSKTHLLQIHTQLIKNSLLQNPIISLNFLSNSLAHDLNYSSKIFTQIENPSPFQYNAMIKASSPSNGFNLFLEMQRKGVKIDALTASFVLKLCIKLKSLMGGLQIHSRILRNGFQSDNRLMTCLMDLYSNCGKCDEVCKVFDEMHVRDTVAWNALISCYIGNGRTRDALSVFDSMQGLPSGEEPDDVTCLLVLQACGNLNALDFGEKIHEYIYEKGYANALKIQNSLISMYSRCDSLEKAYGVFKVMPNKNVVSWGAMISGLAINGYGREALEAFNEMLNMGVSPDDKIFTGVLTACSHGRLVDEGLMFFKRMREEFQIVPNIHHYGCMVDLLARAGLLDKAYEFIMSMDIEPDPEIWRTLLGACRIHRDFDLGEHVIEKLVELKAQQAGDYVLLLNIYSSLGNWEKVMELRRFMKERGIVTTPGSSTISLKGELHEFVADDVSHPQKCEIYEKLGEINHQLKIVGYDAEVTSELHNQDAADKEISLLYHSEKLAIAFAILSTPPGTSIRVAKNFRICVDCHNFAKVLSGVYDRVVVIRDRTRFHHFCGGQCSCNDYW